MPAHSAGLVVYRRGAGPDPVALEVLLVHPGGPYWANKDDGAWSIPKGEHQPDEDPLGVARREFAEELGIAPPAGEARELGEVRQAGGKRVRAWAIAGDLDLSAVASNTFEMEWPPRSGERRSFPEIDRAEWLPMQVARTKILAGQLPLLDRLVAMVSPGSGSSSGG
ncbi:MAG: NUDIX domain-containing protein [Acidimicrobiales bacterium]